MTQVNPNGVVYSDDGSSSRDMRQGGHRTYFFPLIQDFLLECRNFLGTAIGALASAAQSAAVASAASAAASAAAAAASAGVAGSGAATTLAYPILNKAIVAAGDIIGLFVYDTRLDSDGGEWTRKCENTAWYQETLNTATRGARREFPKIAGIVLRSNSASVFTLGIYDLTDLDGSGVPRLWMSFAPAGIFGVSGTNVPSFIFALNGRIYMTLSGSAGRYVEFNFPAGYVDVRAGSGLTRAPQFVSTTTSSSLIAIDSGSALNIVSQNMNTVSARALAGAPLDAFGLPIPTVAVGSAGGVSVIHPNGKVYDITGIVATDAEARDLIFLSDHEIAWGTRVNSASSVYAVTNPIPYADTAAALTAQEFYTIYGNGVTAGASAAGQWKGATSITGLVGALCSYLGTMVIGITTGLVRIARNVGSPTTALMCVQSTSHVTGWMPGNKLITGTWITEALTSNLVGANIVNDNCSATTNWTLNANWALDVPNTEFDHTVGSTATLSRAISGLTSGQRYLVKVTSTNRTAGSVVMSLSTTLDEHGALTITTNNVYLFSFTASGTTDTLVFTPTTDFDGSISDVQFDLSVADRTYRNKDINVKGTLTRAAVNTGNDLTAVSGFSTSNYLEQPYNTDMDFADADFCVLFWLNENANSATETVLERDSTSTAQRFTIDISAAGILQFTTDDNVDVVTSVTPAAIDDSEWHLVACIMRGTTQEIWVDGVLVDSDSASAVDSLTNISAILCIGATCAASPGSPLTHGSIALMRMMAYAPTQAQMARIYADEAPLFALGAKGMLAGISDVVGTLDQDPSRNVLLVATADGVTEFSGLRRVNYLDTVALGTLTNDAMTGVSGSAGFRLLSGNAQVVAYREAVVGVDVLDLYNTHPPASRMTFRGRTIDATPTNLTPRLFVAEREVVVATWRIVARMYADTATEYAAYSVTGTFRRESNGNITLVNSTTTTLTETTAGMDMAAVVDTTSQTAAIQVTGKAATTITWYAEVVGGPAGVTRTPEGMSYAA